MCSLAYQPMAMRFRGLSVLTNTPPPTSQRAPGGAQQNAIMEPLLAKAARRLGIDPVALHRVNAPAGKAPLGGPGKDGKRSYVTSAFVREAIDRGRRALQLGGAQGAQRETDRCQGARYRRRGQPVHRRLLDQLRRPDDHPPRREALRPVWSWKSRNALGHRHGACRGRSAGRAVGERRGRLGRHEPESALDMHVGRQSDRACGFAIESCGRDGRQAEADGDCGADPRRSACDYRRGQRTRVPRLPAAG